MPTFSWDLNYTDLVAKLNSQLKKGVMKAKKMTSVVHCKKEKYDIYIGRPSKWGNPYQIGRDGTREEVLTKFEHWLINTPMGNKVLREVGQLKGKVLGCFCAPNACHGDILKKYIP